MFYDPRTEKHGLKHSPVTAIVVPRPIGWISTISPHGTVNLGPYSFFNLVSGYPPWVIFSSGPRKHSQTNAELSGEFVYNMATWDLREEMNASSAEFAPDVSEPEQVGLEMVPSRNVKPPRIARSPIAIECKYYKTVDLIASDGKQNRSSIVVGEVVGIHIDDSVIVDGMVDIRKLKPISRLGYMDYAVTDDFFTMARPGEVDPRAGG
ncbi:MAG TPA: flavin reductase family protein [Xanthobacteraceae bacterium]|nr:flavin reductase family protein [Xanthobacteraceae bacterium]